MSDIDNSINNLKRLTKELAEEIKYDEIGPLFKFCKLICDNLKTMVIIIGLDKKVKYVNSSCIKYLEENNIHLKVGDIWYCTWGFKCEPDDSIIKKTIDERVVLHKTIKSPITNRNFDVTIIPLIYNGVSGTICLFNQEK